jgi:hypothetical protein
MKNISNSFNASESFPEWKWLYKLMVEQYYNAYGYNTRPSATLQSHFVDLYGAFKNGIRELSVVVGAPKCPAKYCTMMVIVRWKTLWLPWSHT